MYRLSGIQNSLIQRLATAEIIRGFEFVLSTGDDRNIPVEFCLDIFIGTSSVLTALVEKQPSAKMMLSLKLAAMLTALKDTENEYTFDEFGEFLLYELIQYAKTAEEDGAPGWISGGSYFDRRELRRALHAISENAQTGDPEADPEEYAELEKNTLDAILHFPHMDRELDEDTLFPILFWDTDFMLFYRYDFNSLADFLWEDSIMGYSGGRVTKIPLNPKPDERKNIQ